MTPRNPLDQILTGDVFLVRSARWAGGSVIRLRTESVYSHAAMAFRWRTETDATESRLGVVESTWPQGVRLIPFERFASLQSIGRIDWWPIADPTLDREAIARFLIAAIGDRYSLLQLLASWDWVYRAVRRRLRKPADVSRRAWICSELAAAALVAGGYRHYEPLEPAETDPGTLPRFSCLRCEGVLTCAT